MEKDEAVEYLESLVDKILRVHTSDSRVFERNIILSSTHEYRCPTEPAIVSSEETGSPKAASNEPFDLKADMSQRFIGLVVIPGQHITKIELDKPTTGAKAG
ncbi:conserved hypothetical protein [Microsporum canis CBS 113480]|uniref:LSM domain-containing protein n=1 Tax=Arthroderma otae (strain ATCC MYA-4605 / CBS 113480) TaxID=554155 RepID=C5FFX7_ARTOC|nr:conserved hypothetical protein [Microsporum canis CBS 113480]EEQ29662.1 conserved hypothetical protein [Microsporum canis CBS 113480]